MFSNKNVSTSAIAKAIYVSVGGKENIDTVEHCFTRLRILVKNLDKVDVPAIKKEGAKDVIINGENYVQIVLGNKTKEIAENFERLVKKI